MDLTMKNIKKELVRDNIELTVHVQKELEDSGYIKRDVIMCIWKGEITEVQEHQGEKKALIEGFDADKSPMVIVVGYSRRNRNQFSIITAFPPIKSKFKRRVC